MKKLLVAVLALSFSLGALAEGDQPKHIISIGTEGFGWSGLAQNFDWDKDESGVKDHTYNEGNLSLNYSYVFLNRLMLGAELSVKTTESEIKDTAGDKTKTETSETEFGLSLGYNFNEDVYNSWWIKAVIASGNYEEESKDSSGKTEFEYDYNAVDLRGGKRINLDSWGLKNVSYNPSISLGSTTKVSGDAEDAGLEKITQVKIDILRIDILF